MGVTQRTEIVGTPVGKVEAYVYCNDEASDRVNEALNAFREVLGRPWTRKVKARDLPCAGPTFRSYHDIRTPEGEVLAVCVYGAGGGGLEGAWYAPDHEFEVAE